MTRKDRKNVQKEYDLLYDELIHTTNADDISIDKMKKMCDLYGELTEDIIKREKRRKTTLEVIQAISTCIGFASSIYGIVTLTAPVAITAANSVVRIVGTKFLKNY